MKWISVEEKYPVSETSVLLTNGISTRMVYWTGKRFLKLGETTSPLAFFNKAPTHWMPLPEPPK